MQRHSLHRTIVGGVVLALLLTPHALAIIPTQDTDGDNIPDVQEDANGNGIVDPGETDRYNADTDRGGEADGSERAAHRNPFDPLDDMSADPDHDGWVNGIELLNNTDPRNPDTDGDGLWDPVDPFPLDSRYKQDTNSNGLPDEWEKKTGLSQNQVTQTKSDDTDGDGLVNAQELARGTDPTRIDTDHDGIDDKTEIEQGTNPRENACLLYQESSADFEDVIGHWSEHYVHTLQGVSVIPGTLRLLQGYQNADAEALFSPDRPISRSEFLKLVILSTCTKLWTLTERSSVQFSDVRSEPVINENPDFIFRRQIIYTGAHFKIIEGYPDGTFRPDDPVNRAEAVKILSLAARLNLSEDSGATLTFSDVMPSDWFYPVVSLAATQKIVQGYGDGTFRPGSSITRAEAAKIVEVTMRQNPMINGYVLPE